MNEKQEDPFGLASMLTAWVTSINEMWTDIYEREFRQFFQIPQLGLTREYQKRMNTAADTYNVFQSNLSEFMRLMTLPITESLPLVQENITAMAEKEKSEEDAHFYYETWVKTVEEQYMSLFQSPEYMQTLSKTIASLSDFSAARNAAIEDLIGSLPVARRSEMDDLQAEVYHLKKRIRRLEKQLGK